MIQILRRKLDGMPDVRIYQVGVELTKKPAKEYFRNQRFGKSDSLAEFVCGLPGVEMAVIAPYYIVVLKAPMFDWEPIESAVRKLIAAYSIPIEQALR